MHLRDLFKDTVRTLWSHKLRTFLSMFGIIWGIVSIVVMTAAGEGLRVGQQKVQSQFAQDLMIVFAGRTSMDAGGARAGRRISYLSTDLPNIRQNTPNCRYVLPELGQNNIRIRSRNNNAALMVTGSLPVFAEVRSIKVATGRFYNEADNEQGRRVVFLGTDAKQQLFGSQEAVGEILYLNDIPYTVIGVMKRKEQDSSYDGWDVNKLFVPFIAMQRDFPNRAPNVPESLDRLLVQPMSFAQHEECKSELRRILGITYKFNPQDKEAAGIWDTVEQTKAFLAMTDGMKYFLGAVGVTTLFLGGLGVMNVMLVAVRERTREIGVRKAVGATRQAILRQFFTESLIVVLLSGSLGFSVAFGFCGLFNLLPMPAFFAGLLPTWESALSSFTLLGTVAVLAAIYPARRAAGIDPIEALRHEAGG